MLSIVGQIILIPLCRTNNVECKWNVGQVMLSPQMKCRTNDIISPNDVQDKWCYLLKWCAGQMIAGQMIVGQIILGQMIVGQMIVGQMTNCR